METVMSQVPEAPTGQIATWLRSVRLRTYKGASGTARDGKANVRPYQTRAPLSTETGTGVEH